MSVAVLSDLDGVLVDSRAAVARTWTWWADRHGLDRATVDAYLHGRPSAEVIAALAPHVDVAAESALVDARQVGDVVDVRALPGARELLAGVAGDRLAVVTALPS